MGGVFGQPLVTGLPVAELALDDAEQMLHFRPDRGMFLVALALRTRELAVTLGLVQHCPIDTGLARRPFGLLAVIPFVAECRAATLPDELVDDAVVMVARRGDADRMDEAAVGIDADVRFHPEMPSVAFLGRTHLWVAFLPLVFGRGRGVDDGRVNDAAARQQQALSGQVRP